MKYPVWVKIKQGYTGVFIGQCEEIPGAIVQGETPSDVFDKMEECLDAYFDAFPKERVKLECKS